jgi:lipoprotein-releasing system ATP-binding protein
MNDSSKPECLISGRNLHKSYKTSKEILHVLAGADLEIQTGEMLGIIGASGVGKSTLLHVLGGLDCPDEGDILFRGENIYKNKRGYLDEFRNKHVGYVFQFFNLLPDFTALENVMFPALIRNADKKIALDRARELLDQVGLKDRMDHRPGELSGGESQRVALARGLMNKPDILLADEPTGNLDINASDTLLKLIRSLNKNFNQTFVIVTHSQRIAGQMDRVLQLEGGKVNTVDKEIVI